jgi:hypothetical protein
MLHGLRGKKEVDAVNGKALGAIFVEGLLNGNGRRDI